jgi:DNA polymerase V
MEEVVFYTATGFPSPALDYLEERIDLTAALVKNPLSSFLVKTTGNSMINAFIPPQALLLIDRSITPQNGDIILAVLNGQFTVRYLKKNQHKSWLVPANRKYQEIDITSEANMQVWGVVTHIITDAKDVRQCMV